MGAGPQGRGAPDLGRCHEGQSRQRGSGRHGPEVHTLKRIATALAALAALWLAGCAQLPAGNAIQRRPPVLTQFELDGRIVVRESQSRHYANITWRHDGRRDEILLTTPLGQGVAQLSRDDRGARLVMADRKEYVADDWEGLSEQVFGARLPLDDLPQWLSGRAPPSGSGWHVEYLEYQSDAVDALPMLIEARRGDIELRLKVSEWISAR